VAIDGAGPDEGARRTQALSVLIEPGEGQPRIPYEGFGLTVALSGTRVAVTDFLGFTVYGMVFAHVDTFDIVDGVAVEIGRIPALGYPSVCFGETLALDGDLLAIGEPCAGPGVVHVYRFTNGQWVEEPALSPPPEAGTARFGGALAMAANRMVIGASDGNTPAGPTGFVQVYGRYGGEWRPTALLTPAEAQPYEAFGASVAMTADTIAVGAPAHVSVTPPGWGRTTLFRLQATGVWLEDVQLVVADAAEGEMTAGLIALCNGTLFVAGNQWEWPGVHAFTRALDGTWTEGDLYEPPEAVPFVPKVDALACEGDVLAVGMPYVSVGDFGWLGTARIYKRNAGTWARVAEIVGTRPTDRAGHAVALDNGVVAVGIPGALVVDRTLGAVLVQRY
jgi:catechol 2,3-dioxygenase-like lactoylglutathione lyase family enzyme